MTAVIMAGGKGTRLQGIREDIPKPMFLILGKPVLEYQIECLKKSGIIQIIMITGYLKEVIRKYFGDGSRHGVHISYIEEDKPLGTAGAFYYLKGKIKEPFLLLFGDLMLDVDFARFMKFHQKKNALLTLYGHSNSHPYDSDMIQINEQGCVQQILSKNDRRDFYYRNFTNAGLYAVSPEVLETVSAPVKMDLEKDILAEFIKKSVVYAYKAAEYIRDMGTPDRLKMVEKDIRNGIAQQKNMRNKQQAVFFDCSVVIKVQQDICGQEQDSIILRASAAEAVRKINNSRYLAAVVMAGPAFEKKTDSDVSDIQKKIDTELGIRGAYADVYVCCSNVMAVLDEYCISSDNSWYLYSDTVNMKITGMDERKIVKFQKDKEGICEEFENIFR